MHIVVYVLDSLRADYLTPYGFDQATSPNLERLGEESVVCDLAFAQSTWTRPSGVSLFSSTYPTLHGAETTADRYPEELPSIAQELSRAGFTTVAISAMGNIAPAFGFGKGFDEFHELYKDDAIRARNPSLGASEMADLEWDEHFDASHVGIADGADINDRIADVFERRSGEDLFVLVWSLDTHDPYYHRDPELAKFADPVEEPLWNRDIFAMDTPEGRDRLERIYKDMIVYADEQIGDLVAYLKGIDAFEDTLLLVTGDHGEAFGEHGEISHGLAPYEEQIHVPLIMNFPADGYTGRVEGLVELNDIYPTLLDIVGAEPTNEFMQGTSLVTDDGLGSDRDYVFAETNFRTVDRYRCLRTRSHKYIKITPPESTQSTQFEIEDGSDVDELLFDLRADPGETDPIDDPAVRAEFRERLASLVEACQQDRTGLSVEPATPDESIEDQLTALGYKDGNDE